MNMTGQLFHLPRGVFSFSFEETHWSKLDEASAVHHEPTHCVFEITLPDDCDENTPVNGLMLGARLVHVCDGHAVPAREEQETLAREAIAYWAVELGIMRRASADQPVPEIDDDIPF
jgi:hypothetical protein